MSLLVLVINTFDLVCVVLLSGPVEITSAELSHAGRYACMAKNAAGSTQRHVQLTVQGNFLGFDGKANYRSHRPQQAAYSVFSI